MAKLFCANIGKLDQMDPSFEQLGALGDLPAARLLEYPKKGYG